MKNKELFLLVIFVSLAFIGYSQDDKAVSNAQWKIRLSNSLDPALAVPRNTNFQLDAAKNLNSNWSAGVYLGGTFYNCNPNKGLSTISRIMDSSYSYPLGSSRLLHAGLQATWSPCSLDKNSKWILQVGAKMGMEVRQNILEAHDYERIISPPVMPGCSPRENTYVAMENSLNFGISRNWACGVGVFVEPSAKLLVGNRKINREMFFTTEPALQLRWGVSYTFLK
ncbi:hypothetical protein FACS1894201_00790 [Bacteroidia bacterium]|nr:hypothetical protein FACS1894201_00790 [Bacteroidia bacterium]